MVQYRMLNKGLDKIKGAMDIGQLDNTKILMDTDDMLPYDIILKNVGLLMTCVTKDNNIFYSQLTLA